MSEETQAVQEPTKPPAPNVYCRGRGFFQLCMLCSKAPRYFRKFRTSQALVDHFARFHPTTPIVRAR